MPVTQEWDLSGKVALIAAGGRGFAPTLASALAEAGADVAVAGSDPALRRAAVQAVKAQGRKALDIPADLTRRYRVHAAVQKTVSTLGRLDVLVNDQQTEFGKPFADVQDTEWDRLFALNVNSLFYTCQEAGKQMLQQGKGRIINVISNLAERGLWNCAPYCATQAAALQLTKALALEWSRKGVRVNAIGTGFFNTKDVPLEEQQKELLVRYIPSRRKGTPEDLCAILVYLASDVSDFITGTCTYVDGGLMAHA
ncbi:MAG: SDR family oxidoreductase [Chloroflexi bacterium]|nr:SDR family oxidoreductase [Chloroflexota bacterium]